MTDRDDVGWTLPIPLTIIVKQSIKVTLFKSDDDCKEEICLIFVSYDWCTWVNNPLF